MADQFVELGNLAWQGSVRLIRQASQVLRGASAELSDQALLGSRQMGRGALVEQFLLESLGPQRLATPPAAGIGDHFPMLVVDRQGLGGGFDGQPATDVA